MEGPLFAGVFDLSVWQLVAVALGLTHVTIIGVTVFLHRGQTHRALDLHPALNHFFRFWLWLTTGMATREWVAIHRKHHAHCETAEDPHSPRIHGLNGVLWGGVLLYVRESHNAETIERYGHGTPDDWLERNVYSRYVLLGLTLMGVIDVLLFGIVPGVLILVTQIVWIPFWAAGVINGVGHVFGYRSASTPDASTNIVPWGILIGGEELHNNHHNHPTSAKLSSKWYEFDLGWLYIRLFSWLGLARIKRVAPVPHLVAGDAEVGLATVHAVIANRYDVLARYASALRPASIAALGELRPLVSRDASLQKHAHRWLRDHEAAFDAPEHPRLAALMASSPVLDTVVSMRGELIALWARSAATQEELVVQLKAWCKRAEASGIVPLAEFSRHLRRYA